jgi:hypothetical protein
MTRRSKRELENAVESLEEDMSRPDPRDLSTPKLMWLITVGANEPDELSEGERELWENGELEREWDRRHGGPAAGGPETPH